MLFRSYKATIGITICTGKDYLIETFTYFKPSFYSVFVGNSAMPFTNDEGSEINDA